MSDDKTEEPTESKLQKARDKGEVPKSQDLASACALFGVVLVLVMTADSSLDRLRSVIRRGLDFGNGDPPLSELYKTIGAMAIDLMFVIAPFSIVAALFAAVGLVAQTGIIISMEAVQIKLENISPASGIKKVFSVKSLMTFGQMVLKATVLAVVLKNVIETLIPLLAGSVYQSVLSVGIISWVTVSKMLVMGLMLFLLLGPIDYVIQRWQFMKGQRMSKEDIKREYKEQDGDPMVKGQRKQLAHELAESDPQQSVAGANAVVVNPTHYAVAIRYQPGETAVPIIVAKGVDEEAMRIRQYAEQAGVPIFGNPPLARALYKVPLHDSVPEELFEAVAAILRWVNEIGTSGSDRARH